MSVRGYAAEEQFRASLKEIDDFKAVLDERIIVAITDPSEKITTAGILFRWPED